MSLGSDTGTSGTTICDPRRVLDVKQARFRRVQMVRRRRGQEGQQGSFSQPHACHTSSRPQLRRRAVIDCAASICRAAASTFPARLSAPRQVSAARSSPLFSPDLGYTRQRSSPAQRRADRRFRRGGVLVRRAPKTSRWARIRSGELPQEKDQRGAGGCPRAPRRPRSAGCGWRRPWRSPWPCGPPGASAISLSDRGVAPRPAAPSAGASAYSGMSLRVERRLRRSPRRTPQVPHHGPRYASREAVLDTARCAPRTARSHSRTSATALGVLRSSSMASMKRAMKALGVAAELVRDT